MPCLEGRLCGTFVSHVNNLFRPGLGQVLGWVYAVCQQVVVVVYGHYIGHLCIDVLSLPARVWVLYVFFIYCNQALVDVHCCLVEISLVVEIRVPTSAVTLET